MKKIFLLSVVMVSSLGYSQNSDVALSKTGKVELFFDKIGIGYEYPLSNNLLLDLNVGIGGANIVQPNSLEYRMGKGNEKSYNGIYLKGQVRYYFSRENRAKKNRSLVNNAGSFWGVQSKFNFNGNKDYIGKVLMTDVHFGQQLPLGNHFVFRYHVGLGYAKNFDYQYTSLYPAINVAFGYHF